MDTTILKAHIFQDLDEYEGRVRRYLDKVEKDRPWVAESLWQACWNFRRALCADIEFFEDAIATAKRAKDPD